MRFWLWFGTKSDNRLIEGGDRSIAGNPHRGKLCASCKIGFLADLHVDEQGAGVSFGVEDRLPKRKCLARVGLHRTGNTEREKD